ncbi:MAG: tetratricopeptide repeat protein [Gammaproteobacteria bacterium]
MRRRNREINIFNMSLLDILCGALGAFCFMMLAAIPYYGNKGKANASPQKEQQQEQQSSNNQGQYSENPDELKQQLQDLQKRFDESENARKKLDMRFPVTYSIAWSCDASVRTASAAVDADVYIEDDFKNESNGQTQPRFDPFSKQPAYWPGDVHHDALGVGAKSQGQGDFWTIRDLPRGAPLRVFVKFFFPSSVVGICNVEGELVTDKAGEPVRSAVATAQPWTYLGSFERKADDSVEFRKAESPDADVVRDRVDGAILTSANKGDAHAQFYIGTCKLSKTCLSQDKSDWMSWLEKSAKQDYAPAQQELGDLYLRGTDVKQDYALAAKWLKLAAEHGDMVALYELAQMQMNGNGMEKDLQASFKNVQKAALAGYGLAKSLLGYFYQEGVGVERDPAKALEWYRKAAEVDNRASQYQLASFFDLGIGTTVDGTSALEWMRKSADGGFAQAQAQLAQWYYTGHNVDRDEKLGAEWAKKAADQGNEDAKKLLATKGQSAVNEKSSDKENSNGK